MFIFVSYLFWGFLMVALGINVIRKAPRKGSQPRWPEEYLPLLGRWLRYLLAGLLLLYGIFLLSGGFGILFLGYDPWNEG